MNKLRILARKCAALLLLLHCLVATAVHLLREKVQQQCSSFFLMVRRISRLKPATYSASQCSSSNTFPNFAQEKSNLREEVVNPPVEPHFPDSYELGDEYDEEDYDGWLDASDSYDNKWDWDYEPEGYLMDEEDDDWLSDDEERSEHFPERWNPEGHQEWMDTKSWEQEAVDEAIDEEAPGQYPSTFNDDPNPWDGLFGKNRF